MQFTVEKYGLFETAFRAALSAAPEAARTNPYRHITASATVARPDGRQLTAPLFFDGIVNGEADGEADGEAVWRLRLSPDVLGTWAFEVHSDGPGLSPASGQFECVESASRGGLDVMAVYPYHFQRQDGTPVWFLGDTAWALYTDSEEKQHDRAAAEHYINTRAAQGFNAVHSMLISEAGWGNSGGDAFDDLQAEVINPAYWQEVDQRLAHLNSAGITGGLVLAWADKGRNPNNWYDFPSQAARLRYARYITARYSAFDVYFVVAGEWDADCRTHADLPEEQSRAEYAEIGRAIHQQDPHGRLIAIHPLSTGTVREWASEDWISFGDYQQQYPRLHSELLRSRTAQKPVINSEYAYYLRDQNEDGQVDKDNSMDLETIRQASWDVVMAGGYLITGFGSTYFGGYRHPEPFAVDDPRNDDWEEQIQHIKSLFTGLEWWRLEPADARIGCDTPRGEDRQSELMGGRRHLWQPPAVAYWALDDGAGQFVGYVRGVSGPVTLTPGFPADGVQRFDPRTGASSPADFARGGDALTVTPPDGQDWIFVAKRE